MTPINAATAVAQFIRQQSIGLRSSSNAPSQPGHPTAKKPGDATGHDVAALVFRRIRFIEPTDPDRRRKAFRIFIESVLLFELGSDLVNDPKYYELVDEVEARMHSVPALSDAIDEAADRLLSMSSNP
jgi:hypothetical protein